MTGDVSALAIVSIGLLRDQIPVAGAVLPPDQYDVRVGLSRPLTAIERSLIIADSSTGLVATTDLMWLIAERTTLEEVQNRLPEMQSILAKIESEASTLQEASDATSEALQAAYNAEVTRRVDLLGEINQSLQRQRD